MIDVATLKRLYDLSRGAQKRQWSGHPSDIEAARAMYEAWPEIIKVLEQHAPQF